jgi:hypothetical protein
MREPATIAKNDRDHTARRSAELFSAILKGRFARRSEDLDEDTIKAHGPCHPSPRKRGEGIPYRPTRRVRMWSSCS